MKHFNSILAATTLIVASSMTANALDRTDLLFVVGDATLSGWSCDDATALTSVEGTTTFEGCIYLSADKEFKFLTQPDWGNPEYRALVADTYPDADGKVSLTLTSDGDDNKFKVAEDGNYNITIDTEALTGTIVKAEYQAEQVRWASLFMIGDATAGGWSIDQGTLLYQDDADPMQFSAKSVAMNAGSFKIATAIKASGSFDQKWFYFADPEDAAKMVPDADGDHQWTIAEAGEYDIIANLATLAISIEKAHTDGISAITADATGTVAYYNLMGVRIARPAAGQMVIAVDGNGHATKMIF